jgi:ferredoxin--NADP+ reductase
VDPRIYSIASGENDPQIGILYDKKEGGELTPGLAELKRGDHILVSRPFGAFIPQGEKGFCIATGTGLAPFLSYYHSGKPSSMILLHGGRYLGSFYFESILRKGIKDQYIQCCSQENAPGVFYGRVTTWIKDSEELPSDYKYYLCGSAEMVVETRDLLIEKGIPYSNVYSEIYF